MTAVLTLVEVTKKLIGIVPIFPSNFIIQLSLHKLIGFYEPEIELEKILKKLRNGGIKYIYLWGH